IVYSVFENLGIISYVNLVIIALFLPLLPVSIGGLISYFVGLLMRKLKNKSLINIAFSLVLFFGIMYISQNSDSILTYLTANGGNILDAISKYYFPAALILNALNGNILYALLFAALNILPLFLIFPLISRKYSVIVAGYNQVTHKNNYVLKTEKRASPFKSCLKKELSHLFSSANYLLNSASGALMLVVFTIMFVSQKGMQDSLTGLLGASGLGLVVSISAIFACTMTSTTSSAISLEGKTLWIYKSAPVTVLTIFKSKICVNIIINTPLSFIYTTVLSIVFKIPLANAILTTLLPIICIVFTSILGLLINLFKPKMIWQNEIQVIKQSLSVLLTMLCGFLFTALLCIAAIIPIQFYGFGYIEIMLLICAVIILVLIGMYKLLSVWGVKKFNKLY
ncbi:MAG: hypothetical protein RR057_02745, partial [Clostridia bacterium]